MSQLRIDDPDLNNPEPTDVPKRDPDRPRWLPGDDDPIGSDGSESAQPARS